MSSGNGLSKSQEDLEMEGLSQDKRTRFQVNRVRNETPEKNDTVVDLSNEDTEDEDGDHLLSVTDRTRLNSETDTKYAKSFR